MRRSSLRTWLLIASSVLAVAIVGGVALTTYVVVSDAMAEVAHETVQRGATTSVEVIANEFDDVMTSLGEQGLEGEAQVAAAHAQITESPSELLASLDSRDGSFVLFDENLDLLWASSEGVVPDGGDEGRLRALESGEYVEARVNAGGALDGLLGSASLGTFVAHVPIQTPSGETWVLDVVYEPVREEQIIDAIRLPMAVLALAAMTITVVMMQVAMAWVLRLVDNLREAADSVDAGNLSVRLPAEGDHEIGDLGRSLNKLLDRLQRRAEGQVRFVADASHELATPVAGIRGYTNILRAWGKDDPEVRDEAISAIDRESRRMARLCSDLLALVRDEREMVFNEERFDVNARVREILAAAATRYMHKGLEFIGPEEGQLMLVSDPDRIEDAVSILVDNAAKYTPDGGAVSATTRRRRDMIIIEVADTGIGIPEEDLTNIFERFYRSDTSRSKMTGGFGLGLPIAKTIIDAAGGEISIDSTVGEGSKFTIALPRSRR